MIKGNLNQEVPQVRVEPNVNDEARPEIASKGVKVDGVEEKVSSPAKIERKKAPLKKKKALGKKASVKKKKASINKGTKTRKEDDKEKGIVKVKKEKVVVISQPVVPVKRKVGRPRLTSKQKFVNKIIRDAKKIGDVISVAQADIIYYKIKEAGNNTISLQLIKIYVDLQP
jgi:flagellum-specific peptidoglycan hydrolase FlgJ